MRAAFLERCGSRKNVILNGVARRRVFAMRRVFEHYRRNLSAIYIVAQKD